MIVKKENGSEIERMKMVELEDRMHKMGHTDFKIDCMHTITEDLYNPDGSLYRTVCVVCKLEWIR